MWLLVFNNCMCAKSLSACLTLCDPMDCNLPGSSIHGILQGRILEWVTIPGNFKKIDPGPHCSLPLSPTYSWTWHAF